MLTDSLEKVKAFFQLARNALNGYDNLTTTAYRQAMLQPLLSQKKILFFCDILAFCGVLQVKGINNLKTMRRWSP